jgi:hypothetical protein
VIRRLVSGVPRRVSPAALALLLFAIFVLTGPPERGAAAYIAVISGAFLACVLAWGLMGVTVRIERRGRGSDSREDPAAGNNG